MRPIHRVVPHLIVATAIAAVVSSLPAADDDPPAPRTGAAPAAPPGDSQDAPAAGSRVKNSPPTSRARKSPPKSAGAKPPQGERTAPQGPLFGPNPGAKSPMPSDGQSDAPDDAEATGAFNEPLPKTLEEWKSRLTAEQFYVTRMKGTERAFTGKYWKTETPGTYKCVCCGEPLFTSGDKFISECGWPAFSAPIDKKANGKVAETPDFTFGMRRVEVTCRKCGAHLGHVFNDGPPPTGIRYCINSASIVLEEAKPGDGKDADREADGATGTGGKSGGTSGR